MPEPVLYLSPVGRIGGAEESLLDLAAGLDRRQFVPRLLALGHGPLLDEACRRGVDAQCVAPPAAFVRTSLRGHRTPTCALALAVARAGPTARAIVCAARMTGATIVHSNGNKTHLLSAALKRPNGPRIVWHVRDLLPERAVERWLVRIGNCVAAAVIANSHAVAARLRRLGARADRLHVIHNGVDPDRFCPDGPVARLHGEFGWPPTARLVGLVAHLAPWKGQTVFLEAARAVVARHPDVRFVLVGDEIYETSGHGDFAGRLRALARDLGLSDVVGFAGMRRDIASILRALDVVIHASLEPEPFGRVIVEALACARPVVATRGGGVDEVLEGLGLAGLATRPGNPDALSAAILTLLDDPGRASNLAAEGRQRMLARFLLTTHVASVQDLYCSLGGPREQPPRA